MKAFRCEKCKKHFDGDGVKIEFEDIGSDGSLYVSDRIEVCQRCFKMINRFCKHIPKAKK